MESLKISTLLNTMAKVAVQQKNLQLAEFRAGWPQGIAPLGLPQISTCTFAQGQ